MTSRTSVPRFCANCGCGESYHQPKKDCYCKDPGPTSCHCHPAEPGGGSEHCKCQAFRAPSLQPLGVRAMLLDVSSRTFPKEVWAHVALTEEQTAHLIYALLHYKCPTCMLTGSSVSPKEVYFDPQTTLRCKTCHRELPPDACCYTLGDGSCTTKSCPLHGHWVKS